MSNYSLKDAASPSRASSCNQAKLLHGRGDIKGKRASFDVKLPSAGLLAQQFTTPCRRIGLDLRRDIPERLLVAGVDTDPSQKTAVARWNCKEERQSKRGDGETHASMALLPGDRLKAINDISGGTAMFAELEEAMNATIPKEVSLAVSRDISGVWAPSPDRFAPGGAFSPARAPSPARLPRIPGTPPTPARLPSLLPRIPGTPPVTPPRSALSGPRSRASSVGSIRSTRSRSGSIRRGSMHDASCGSVMSISVPHPGLAALAF